MYYPGLYAGSADLVAKHDGEITIIDFKQTNKPKREEWIEIISCSWQLMLWHISHLRDYH